MPYQTKKQLRDAVARLQKQLETAEFIADQEQRSREIIRGYLDRRSSEARAAEKALEELAFEPIYDLLPVDGGKVPNEPRQIIGWRRPAGFVATDLDEIREMKKVAADNARHETLLAVIDALGIKGYEPPMTSSALRELIKTGERPASTAHLDRFWADLQTALEVRAERKTQTDREATEKRVTALAEHPTAGQIAGALADRIDLGSLFAGPITPCIDEDCACKTLKSDDIADSVTRLADGVKKQGKKSKKEKAA